MILLLSFNWERTVSRVPQARRTEGHGTSWHRTARLRRAWTSIFGNYAHSRRPWRGSTDRQPERPCTPSNLSPRIYGTVHSQGGRPFRTRLRQHLLGRRLQHGRSCHFLGIRKHTVAVRRTPTTTKSGRMI